MIYSIQPIKTVRRTTLKLILTVNRANREVSVSKMLAAHDCGLIVNPDGVSNQVEGCLVQA